MNKATRCSINDDNGFYCQLVHILDTQDEIIDWINISDGPKRLGFTQSELLALRDYLNREKIDFKDLIS